MKKGNPLLQSGKSVSWGTLLWEGRMMEVFVQWSTSVLSIIAHRTIIWGWDSFCFMRTFQFSSIQILLRQMINSYLTSQHYTTNHHSSIRFVFTRRGGSCGGSSDLHAGWGGGGQPLVCGHGRRFWQHLTAAAPACPGRNACHAAAKNVSNKTGPLLCTRAVTVHQGCYCSSGLLLHIRVKLFTAQLG